LRNGRLAGAVGLTTEWRNVTLGDSPSWSAAAHSHSAMHWTRFRDVMPGYRVGVKDELSLRVVDAPRDSALRGVDPKRFTWFEERVESAQAMAGLTGRSVAHEVLPTARYAVDFGNAEPKAIYGEQCLAPKLCFAWQRWPVDASRAAGRQQ